jgi:hypothetical protein
MQYIDVPEGFVARITDYIVQRTVQNIALNIRIDRLALFSIITDIPVGVKVMNTSLEEVPEKIRDKYYSNLLHFTRPYALYSAEEQSVTIFFEFVKIETDSFDTLESIIKSDNFKNTLGFAYAHEFLHILQKHHYHDVNFKSQIRKQLPAINDKIVHRIFNYAVDYHVNSTLIENGSPEWEEIKQFCLYKPEYSAKYLNESQIIERIITEIKKKENQQRNQGKGKPQKDKDKNGDNGNSPSNEDDKQETAQDWIEVDGKVILNYPQDELKDNNSSEQEQAQFEEIASLVRNKLLQKLKGSDSLQVLSNLGALIEVEKDWVKNLSGLIATQVFYRTRQTISTWAKPNVFYKHKFKLPHYQFIDNKLKAYISIDHSGSITDVIIRKINFLILEIAKKADNLILLVHDSYIVHYEEFKGKNMKNDFSLIKLLKTRYSVRGTSHQKVFERIEEDMNANKKEKAVYICFSDMESDIEEFFPLCENLNKAPVYWVSDRRFPRLDYGNQILID